MKNNIKHVNDLQCIKVIHMYSGINSTEMLSFNQFYTSFVADRCEGERRTNKQYTIFGYWHTKTTLTNPYNNVKSVRVFEFPDSEEQARELDYNYHKELERGAL